MVRPFNNFMQSPLLIPYSRHEGHAYMEYDGRHPRSHQRRSGHGWESSGWYARGILLFPVLLADALPLQAWVLGATDPTSGTVSTYEVIRGLGVLLKKGWTPLRTILIASWDAEEVSLQARYQGFHLLMFLLSTVLSVAQNGAKTSQSGFLSMLLHTSTSVSPFIPDRSHSYVN